MIVINVVILALCFLQNGKVCYAAETEGGRLRQFLRRRTGSQIKRESVGDSLTTSGHGNAFDEAPTKKFIGFSLRQRAKSIEKPASPPPTTLSGAVFGFISSTVAGISRTLDVIDNLEKEYEIEAAPIKLPDTETISKSFVFSNSSKRAKVVNQLLNGIFNDFDEEADDESEVDSKSSGDVPDNQQRDLAASGITINEEDYENNVLDSYQRNLEGSFHSDGVQLDYLDEEVHNKIMERFSIESDVPEETKKPEEPQYKIESKSTKESKIVSEELVSSNPEDIRSNYIILSDSDSESWENIEQNMIENVQILVKQPEVAKFVGSFGNNRNQLVDFLATVFVKLAKKIFFKPSPSTKLQKKSDSFEDFVTEFDVEVLTVGPDGEKIHKVLDFETAHHILFYNTNDSEDWDWCLILPNTEDFSLALDYVSNKNLEDMKTIEIDLPRLSLRFYDYYAERRGRGPLETDADELKDKIRLILAFMMAFESKEVSHEVESFENLSSSGSTIDFNTISKSIIPAPFKDQQIHYLQGFDSIVAYFAINFELDCAGPLAYRFFQLYLSELINIKTDEIKNVMRKIDARAVNIVRAYLRDQVGGLFILDFEVLLGILGIYPFSDSIASLLYTTSATTWTDLDRLIQFLLLKVPQSEAYKSVSLLAAANMLFSMLSLEKLFRNELFGSETWADIKDQLNHAQNNQKRREMFEALVLKFMGELFLLLKDKIVHAGEEFDEFLKVAESLVPYLHHFN